MKNTKKKKYKASKRTWIILSIFLLVLICIITGVLLYTNSEKYEKKKVEKTMEKWAKEYYTDQLVKVASGYIKTKAERDESITINIDALKKYGKDTSQIKNTKKNKQCNDIESYVSIKIKKDAKNIAKDFILEKVVLDCFE